MCPPEVKTDLPKICHYTRMAYDDIAVYIDPEAPNWFAVNPAGDDILRQRTPPSLSGHSDVVWEISRRKFMNNLPEMTVKDYTGRADYINLSHLDECWLHITDACNLKCTHCLFSCSPGDKASLSLSDIRQTIDETRQAGASVFYITGGEPFVHQDIEAILTYLLIDLEDTKVVLLTNGVLIPTYIDFLKTLPAHRLFFQVSADGIGAVHDRTRGKNAFKRLLKGLDALSGLKTRTTLSMVVHTDNLFQMKALIDLACDYHISTVHYMWLFITGSAKPEIFAEPDVIFTHLTDAAAYAGKKQVEIDNIKSLESQLFSPVGTKYDLGNAGWRSLAIGPDGYIYPTAATIHEKPLRCGHLHDGIETVWQTSDVLRQLRQTSVKDTGNETDSPLKFITGGGDIDHSYFHGGTFEGNDPYLRLYDNITLWLIAENARKTPPSPYPAVLVKMGDRLLHCHSEGDGVSLTHSNCVLTLSSTKKVVGDFYTQADASGNDDIVNPVCYPEDEIAHIPGHSRIKSYGCGSPVLDAGITDAEVIADLGSGAGVECFIAAKKTGRNGKVYGIDMLDHMLEKATATLPEVADNLGYNNIEFLKGFLETIPLPDNEVDLITSNCVINLSEDKRQTLREIFRVLKPGGRIVISDVVTDAVSPPSIQNDEQLQGECIAGAMVQHHLLSMLESIGFSDISIMKRFFYRRVKNHDFYSLTYTAYKPGSTTEVQVIYPGPYAAVITDNGDVLVRGQIQRIKSPVNPGNLSPDILILDDQGNAANIEADNACGCDCYIPPDTQPVTTEAAFQDALKQSVNCMVCGSDIDYLSQIETRRCAYCSKESRANAVCQNGHFVCDTCHGADALGVVKTVATHTNSTDLIDLMTTIRAHKALNVHGPEHHFTLPAVITAVYKNQGGTITNDSILKAIERGASIPGGSCAFWGGCGAPLGAGVAFAVILDSNPLKPKERQIVQQVVSQITAETGKLKAARCCQRECWITLLKVSQLSKDFLGIHLPADGPIVCTQADQNNECIKKACPFYE